MFKDVLLTTGCFALIAIVAITIGRRLLRLVRFPGRFGQTLALSYLLGFSVMINGVVVLAVLHLFYFWIIVGGLIGLVIWLRHDIRQLGQDLWQRRNAVKTDWLLKLVLLGLILVSGCTAFAPPVDRDAIAYHLPEAKQLVANHSYTFDATIEKFYVNLPLFMETAYAFGILLTGYSLAHLFHYAILVSLIIFLFSWLQHYYSARSALWATIGLFGLDSFVRIATTGLVDTAYMSLEIISVCLVVTWVKERDRSWLVVAGSILGIALSIKYSPVFTVAFCLIVIGLASRKGAFKAWLHFMIPLLLFGGGWYLKNLLRLGNPIYPFVFGHAGYGEANYLATVAVTQDFQFPRTLWNYLQLPWLFFGKSWWETPYMIENLLSTPQTLVVLIGLLLVPLILVVPKAQRPTTWLLASYMVGFTLYWFFIATHLVRFLDTASVMLVILAAIGVTMLEKKLRWLFLFASATVVLGVGIAFGTVRSTANLFYTSFMTHIARRAEVEYVLGRQSKLEYLQQSPILDCGYSVLDYLQHQDPTAQVLDNWSEWHNWHFKFYNTTIQFYTLPPNLSTAAVTEYVQTNAIEYVYFNALSKADFPVNSTDYVREHYQQRYQQEQQLLDQSQLVYSFDSCELYQFTPTGDRLDEVGLTN